MKRRPLTDRSGEVRELTAADFKGMRPLSEIDPGMIPAMKEMRNKGGRPKAEAPKVHIGFRFAPDLVQSIKSLGKGYNVRVEKALREALALEKQERPSTAEKMRKRRVAAAQKRRKQRLAAAQAAKPAATIQRA